MSLDVAQGEVVSIIGPNGSGKSTLLRCIGQFDRTDDGEISIGETTRGSHTSKEGRSPTSKGRQLHGVVLGTVFQDSRPWPHLDVMGNLLLPLTKVAGLSRAEALGRAKEVLETFGVLDRAEASPQQLSGGLKQRVVLARTMVLRPRVLLLDEVTSALDPDWTERVRQILRTFVEDGGTILNVSHQMGFVRRLSDRVIFLHEGTALEWGTPKGIFDTPRTAELREFLTNA